MINQKQQLREELAKIRKSISNKSNPDISERSKLICDILLKDERIIEANNILLYYPTLDEVDIRPVIEYCWENGKNVYLPFIKEIKIGKVEGMGDLKDFGLGFKEPTLSVLYNHEKDCNKLRIDLIILPGLGFDKEGNRLGHGKGWYDRFISTLEYKPILIGVCFKEQLLEGIPHENYDIRMEEIISI